MRVALISEHASPLAAIAGVDAGGQNVHVAELAAALHRQGHAVTVYTRRDAADLPETVRTARGFTVVHVPAGPARYIPKDELLPYMRPFGQWLAARWAADGAPDIVHAHFWMSGVAAEVATSEVPAPMVQTFHALGSVKRRHQGSADTSPPERMATERRLLRTVDAVIATCHDEVAELRALGATAPTAVVPCGVNDDFSAFGALDPVPRARRHRLVCVSRLVPRKGIADVISALGVLGAAPDAELVIVGGADADQLADDAEARHLLQLASELGVADRLRFRGRLGAAEVAAVMRSADAVVCAPWYEPFGIVPVEAMACGVPVIGTAVGGLLDTVVPGVTGVLVPARRPDRLADAIRDLLADPIARRRMGEAGAQRANGYRWPRVAQAVLGVYRDVIGRRHQLAAEAALA